MAGLCAHDLPNGCGCRAGFRQRRKAFLRREGCAFGVQGVRNLVQIAADLVSAAVARPSASHSQAGCVSRGAGSAKAARSKKAREAQPDIAGFPFEGSAFVRQQADKNGSRGALPLLAAAAPERLRLRAGATRHGRTAQ